MKATTMTVKVMAHLWGGGDGAGHRAAAPGRAHWQRRMRYADIPARRCRGLSRSRGVEAGSSPGIALTTSSPSAHLWDLGRQQGEARSRCPRSSGDHRAVEDIRRGRCRSPRWPACRAAPARICNFFKLPPPTTSWSGTYGLAAGWPHLHHPAPLPRSSWRLTPSPGARTSRVGELAAPGEREVGLGLAEGRRAASLDLRLLDDDLPARPSSTRPSTKKTTRCLAWLTATCGGERGRRASPPSRAAAASQARPPRYPPPCPQLEVGAARLEPPQQLLHPLLLAGGLPLGGRRSWPPPPCVGLEARVSATADARRLLLTRADSRVARGPSTWGCGGPRELGLGAPGPARGGGHRGLCLGRAGPLSRADRCAGGRRLGLGRSALSISSSATADLGADDHDAALHVVGRDLLCRLCHQELGDRCISCPALVYGPGTAMTGEGEPTPSTSRSAGARPDALASWSEGTTRQPPGARSKRPLISAEELASLAGGGVLHHPAALERSPRRGADAIRWTA